MYNISNYFNIGDQQPELEFVDIRLDRDNPLFLDPRLIEMNNDDLSRKMLERINVFWAELFKAIKAKNKPKIYQILGGLKEPNETRLGYAFSNRGNSVADKLKPELVEALRRNIAIMTGVLSHFCDVEFVVENISSDRISDITTKIVKEVLIEFTQEQCRKVDNPIPMKQVWQDDIFNHTTVTWERKKVELPIYFGKPIIFVPKNCVRLEGMAGQNFKCFYRFAVRHFIANDPNMLEDVSPSGKDGEIRLRDIQSKYPISKESIANWVVKYGKLLVDFKTDKLSERVRHLSDSEIMDIVYLEDLRDAG